MVRRLKKDHLLVVGGTGFIGYHLIKKAVKKKWNITSVSLNKPKKNRKVRGVTYIFGDISKPEQIKKKLKYNFSYVVNAGGYSLYEYSKIKEGNKKLFASHFLGLKNLIENLQLKYIKKFVHIGTADEYGKIKSPQKETYKEKPINSYGKVKLLCTKYLMNLNKSIGFPAVVLRFFLTYGPGQDKNRVIRQTIDACLKNKTLKTSKGEALRDFCYIDDAVKSILLSLKSNKTSGQILNVGSGRPIKVKNIINLIRNKIKSGKVKFGSINYRPGEVMVQYPELKKIRKLIGWSSKTSLNSGLNKTIKYFKNC